MNLATGSATGTGGVNNVRRVKGGKAKNTLIGPDTDSAWTVTGAGTGSVGGVDFINVQNLVGEVGADTFAFTGGSAASVCGGSGADTLDLSSDTTGVTIDINTGTATYAGTISRIENVITGAGDDTLIGALAGVLLDTGSGTDTLDLSAVTADLTITIHANGTVSVTDGVAAHPTTHPWH